MRASPARVAVASKPPTRPSSARRLPRPRRAALLIAVSALVVIAVAVTAFALSQHPGGASSLSAADRQSTQIASAQATHAVATTTADARRGLQPWSPEGGPGPCDPTERVTIDVVAYWQMDQPSAVTCEPDGKTARIGAGKSGQSIPAIHFYGLPWYYPQYSNSFPDQFTVDMDIGFTSSDPGGQYNNEYCATLMMQLQNTNGPATPALTFCRDGAYSTSLSNGVRHPYALKSLNHLRLTVTADKVGMDLNGQSVLPMTAYEPPVSNLYLFFTRSSDTASEAITVTDFVFTPTAQ